MKTWYVEIEKSVEVEIEAQTEEQAIDKAMEKFDNDAVDIYIEEIEEREVK